MISATHDNRKWWVLFTMCLLTVMLNFDVTAVNLAIPDIAHEFHASLDSMQWVINAFVLLAAMFQIVGGRAGDIFGHRLVFVIGSIIFIITSMTAGISHNEIFLILSRVGQGFALGIAYPMTIALVYEAFPMEQRGLAVGYIMGTMGVSLAIGPTLGGIIVHYIGWRWIFLVNVPIGILTVIMTYIFCRPDKTSEKVESIDYLGAILLILAMLGIVLALNQLQQWGVDSLLFWLTLMGGILALVVLYFVEKHKTLPVVDFQLFKIKNFSLYCIIRFISQLVFIPILFFVPIYLQNVAGYSPISTGVTMLFLTVVVGLLSPLAGKFVDKLGARGLTIFSSIVYALACLIFFLLNENPNHFLLPLGLFLIGIASGIAFVSTTSGATLPLPIEKTGVAMGIFLTIVWVSCAVGVALMGALIAINAKAFLLTGLNLKGITLDSSTLSELVRMAQGVSSSNRVPQMSAAISVNDLSTLTKAAFMHGFRVAMIVFGVISLIGLLFTLLTDKFTAEQSDRPTVSIG